MFVIVTNIPTPYRTAFFNVLNGELGKQNIPFHVIYCALSEPRRFWEFNPNENLYKYTFLRGLHPKFKGYYPHFNFSLIRYLKKNNPDHILLAGSWNAPSVFNICRKKGEINSKLIFWSEGHQDAVRIKYKIIDKMRDWIFKRMDGFVVPNKKSKSYIETFRQNIPIGFLPNTIDEIFFSTENLLDKNELRKKLNFSTESKIIVLVSSLTDRKGVWETLQAYNLLEDFQKLELELIFVGTGELHNKLLSYKHEHSLKNVHIVGQVNPTHVRNFLHISDVFALPTKLDPNPLTPIEASFMKTPIILSNKAGNHEELVNELTGFTINEVNEKAIYESFIKILNTDKIELTAMGENAYENVSKNFSRKAASLSLINFLNSLS